MSTKFPVRAQGLLSDKQFPEIPPEDINNTFYLNEPAYLASLIAYFGNPDSTIVTSEAPVGWNTSQRTGLFVSDLLIAFDADTRALRRDMGCSIQRQGKAPEFVLEIGSASTGERDDTVKRIGYAAFGVAEYWRFDPSGGQFHQTHLAGDRLVNGEYQPLPIRRSDDEYFWGHSEVLNLDLCWEQGELRWYDPAGQRYLPSFDDERAARIAAEARVRELEERLRQSQEPGTT